MRDISYKVLRGIKYDMQYCQTYQNHIYLYILLYKTHFDDKWRLNRNYTKIRYFTPFIINVKPKISQEYCVEMSDENLFTASFTDVNLCRQPLYGNAMKM